MSKQLSFAHLIITLIALTQAGCHLPFWKGDSRLRPTVGAATPPQFLQNELSPQQAAKACIVTAEKLEGASHRREAIGLYEKARQQDPKAIDYARRLAVLYDQDGDAVSALREYDQALAADPKNADLWNDFGYFYLARGDLASAETNLRMALSLDQQHPRAWTNLGIVLAHQSRHQEAFEAFSRIVGPAAAHSNLGAVLAKQGHTQQAQLAFHQALAIDPTLKQPQAFLAHYAKPASLSAAKTLPASFTTPM